MYKRQAILETYTKEYSAEYQAQALIDNKIISGGMIPKVETCIEAVQGGAEGAVIMDGRVPHALLVELFTEHGMGTIITAG